MTTKMLKQNIRDGKKDMIITSGYILVCQI
jgi:hypothetical protein